MEHEGQTNPAGAVWVGKLWTCDIKHFVCITSKGCQEDNTYCYI